MASQKPLQEGDLNDSWVELTMQQNAGATAEPTIETPVQQTSVYNGNLEKLLIEAQRESRTASYANSKESSARGSPKSPPSPTNSEGGSTDGRTRVDPGSDWIWDWSSGPEIQPQGDWSEKFRHPGMKSRRMPAKAPVTKSGIFRLENLPTLLLTHACTFFLGAAFMFMYLKKYCNWTAVVSSALD